MLPRSVLATLIGSVLTLGSVALSADSPSWTPAPQAFRQELADVPPGLPAGPAPVLDLSPQGTPLAFAGGRWFSFGPDAWKPSDSASSSADLFPVVTESGRTVGVKVPGASVRQVARGGGVAWVVAAKALFRIRDDVAEAVPFPPEWELRQVAVSKDGTIAAATTAGLKELRNGRWEAVEVFDAGGRAWAVRDVLGAAYDAAGRLWFASRAGVGVRQAEGWRFFEGKDGLPWNDFTGVATGPDGAVWFGTRLGVIRWDGSDFHYRQGLRWLPGDEVRSLVVGADGSAWVATEQGVGRIRFERTTLARKAAFYEEEIGKYVKRTPYGFTAEAPLAKRADKASAQPNDSDNDGLWTAMYGAGECFAFAATQDPEAHKRATQAFEALRFLQKVTQGGNPSPPKGYVARTVRPVEWPDPNVGRIEGDREEAKRDALWKVYEPRWPRSADGKWFWKSDTSSDELDGHFFLYAAYFDHVAKTEEEKGRVREVVRDLADHLVSHGFNLVDIDGKPTRWGVYGPDSVNGDPRWFAERGLNSLSILSYMAVASHVTGDPKYNAAARELVVRHGYAQNLIFPKVQFGPGSGNQSDDEMAFMCFYNLMKYGRDPEVRDRALFSFYAYWAMEAPEMNPFFHFAYAAQATEQKIRIVWGEFPVTPWKGWHEDSMATLRGFPLDRLNWASRNSHRLDIEQLPPQKSKDLYDPNDRHRGQRRNGKVLPVENRHFEHWNTDPWTLDYGGNGEVLGSGTVFLLPYYMGLYHGFIEKP